MARAVERGLAVPTATGVALGLAGVGLVGVGLWARRDVTRVLVAERINASGDGGSTGTCLSTAGEARAMADVITQSTVESVGGRTYAETDPYLDSNGKPTPDAAHAATDERTGQPVANPDYELWIQATALRTALMQAYMAFRLAELTIGLGALFVTAGFGLGVTGRRKSGTGLRMRM